MPRKNSWPDTVLRSDAAGKCPIPDVARCSSPGHATEVALPDGYRAKLPLRGIIAVQPKQARRGRWNGQLQSLQAKRDAAAHGFEHGFLGRPKLEKSLFLP